MCSLVLYIIFRFAGFGYKLKATLYIFICTKRITYYKLPHHSFSRELMHDNDTCMAKSNLKKIIKFFTQLPILNRQQNQIFQPCS
jgi:hypothetical protein